MKAVNLTSHRTNVKKTSSENERADSDRRLCFFNPLSQKCWHLCIYNITAVLLFIIRCQQYTKVIIPKVFIQCFPWAELILI